MPPFRCTESPFDPERIVALSSSARALYGTMRLLLAAAREEYPNDPSTELAAARQEAHRNIPGGCV